MKKTLFILLLALTSSICCNAQINSILGEWVTIDDKSGQEMAVVKIYKATNGKYYGKIVKTLVAGGENHLCTECTGADKDQPVVGLIIVRNMVEKDGKLVDGKVLDPNNGKFYYASITYDADNNRLKLRGSLDKAGMLGRNQYWKKR